MSAASSHVPAALEAIAEPVFATVGQLLGRHGGETAWIFGKAPSLDRFEMGKAGPLRICINESVLRVPDASYFFAHDEAPILNVAPHWPSCCKAILQPDRAGFAFQNGIPQTALYTYQKLDREYECLDWTTEKIAERSALFGLTGTVHSALHFCKLIGARSIAFVGMDGGPDYAQSLDLPAPPGGGRHDRIRQDSEEIAERLDLSYVYAS